MNVAVDKIMEARNYDGIASKMRDDSKKTAPETPSTSASEALKMMFPFMADYSK